MTAHMYPIDTEHAAIGILTLVPDRIATAAFGLAVEDFADPKCAGVFAAMLRRQADGHAADYISLASEKELPDIEWFNALMEPTPSIGALPSYVEVIREAARLRHAALAGSEICHAIQNGDTTATEALARFRELADDTSFADADGRITHTPAIDLYDEEDTEDEWLVPGVIAKGWRVILAGSEGIGKMTLLRLIGACAAAGVNPFAPKTKITRRRVLVVDVETPKHTVREQLKLLGPTRDLLDDAGDLFQQSLLRSLDLVNSPTDRLRLEQLVADVQPEILIIGPLYKICPHSPMGNYDAEAMEVIGLLDRIRDRYDVAMLIEQHVVADKQGGTTRNTAHAGSAQFIRWCDMAVSMVEDIESPGRDGMIVKLSQQRGVRGEHAWPEKMHRRTSMTATGMAWQAHSGQRYY